MEILVKQTFGKVSIPFTKHRTFTKCGGDERKRIASRETVDEE